MRTAAIAAQMIVRLLGIVLLVLGVCFWLDYARGLVSLHMSLGGILVLALWLLAAVGARARVGTGLVIASALWGAVVLVVGMGQRAWLPGSMHWIVQVAHLIIGLAAMGLAEAIGGRVKRGVTPAV